MMPEHKFVVDDAVVKVFSCSTKRQREELLQLKRTPPSTLTDFIASILSSRAASGDIQARIGELACKSTEGRLSDVEKADYLGDVRAIKLVATLQRFAQHFG